VVSNNIDAVGDPSDCARITGKPTRKKASAKHANAGRHHFGRVLRGVRKAESNVNSRCVIIPMQETNQTNLAKPTDKKMLDIADVLRHQLLQYRLERYNSLRLPKVEGDERLHSRTRDLYQALALPLGKNADLCEYLVHLFETQQEINREPLSPASAAVL